MAGNELLERKQYLLGITIIEGRALLGKDSAGTSDPYVKIKCAGQTQQTSKKYEVNSATWNQSITFPGLTMNQYELETFELNLEVYDHNALLANALIGQYSIGLSTLYRNLNHEFYKVWVGLFNRENPNITQGYLQFSAFIIGPNERPPVHAQDEDFGDDEQDVDSEEDDDAIARRIESIKRAQGIMQVFGNPNKIDKSYQMTVLVAVAQNLPRVDSKEPKQGKVAPFVSCRINGCVLTTGTKQVPNPKFNSKLQFPIFYPILNNKITMRIWSKASGLKANVFIASIPEHPDPLDQFNLTKLMTQDGRMKARWINLYGLHPLDRKSNTKGKKEGSAWLGRVLIAFNMVSNDRPQLQSQVGSQINEPKTLDYKIWVDLYKIVDCEIVPKGSQIWAVVSIGPVPAQTSKSFVYNEAKCLYKYKDVLVDTPDFEHISTLPADQSQIPDIFIDIYTTSGLSNKEVRVAYIRLKAVDCISTRSRPTWYRLCSPYNDTGSKNIGSLQANVQLLKWYADKSIGPARVPKQRKGKQQYKFYFHILSGFEVATAIDENTLKTRVDLKIGNLNVEKDGCKTDFQYGHYPIWDVCKYKDVFLETELAFEADMRVTVQNQKTGLFGSLSNQVVGEFCVPVQSMMLHSEKPQFFNLINEEGKFMGQILANFLLKIFVRDPKTRKIKGYKDPAIDELKARFTQATEKAWEVDIKFSILGVRNLMLKAKKPQLVVRLTNDESSKQIIDIDQTWAESMDQEGKGLQVNSPNFARIVTFSKVTLYEEPLFWPYIQIQMRDKAKDEAFISAFAAGCEESFTTISLVDYAKDFLSEYDIVYAKAQISRNQDRLLMVQPQIQDKQFISNLGVIVNFNNLAGGDVNENDIGGRGTAGGAGGGGRATEIRQSVMPNGQLMNVMGDARDSGAQKDADHKNIWRDWQRMDVLKDELSVIIGGDEDGGGPAGGGAEEEDSGEIDDEGALIIELGGDAGTNDLETGVIIETDNVDEIQVFVRDKEKEDQVRQAQIEELDLELKAFMKKLKGIEDQVQKDKVRFKMMEITDEMDALRTQNMTEEKFWGMLALNDDAAFDYGRDILKEGTYETVLKLPYEQFPLFTKASWHKETIQTPIVQVDGILRSGNLSGASIKGKIQMSLAGELDEEEDEESPGKVNGIEDVQVKGKDKKEEKKKGNRSDMINEMVMEVAEEFPFRMIEDAYLQRLNESLDYKVRVYLISAQNLTATGVSLDLKSRLAGMTALCTANPYPIIELKGAQIIPENRAIKRIEERDLAMANNLNPKFFRVYELDVFLPEEHQLEIKIMDKAYASYADSLIGQTTIDLENRLYGNMLFMTNHSLEIEMESIKEPIKETKKKAKKDKKLKKKLLQLMTRQKHMIAEYRKMKAIEQILIPVEFRELTHPTKNQAQGIVEMWTEIYTEEQAKKIEIQKMQTIKKETYEIRLVVWETRDVPLVDGDDVDIWVRVTFDPTGRPEDEVEKRTDVHNNSKTGWGQFNWRFKFDITIPCDFPRIKFTVHDEGVIVDEAIGEATLNLKRTLAKMEREGYIEVPKTYITCANANLLGEDRGNLMFSMTILTKEDADDDPVGESWDEPNHDPVLKKPTAGRGLAGLVAGGGWNFDFAWNPFGKLLPFILCMMVFLTLLTIFMYGKMMGLL